MDTNDTDLNAIETVELKYIKLSNHLNVIKVRFQCSPRNNSELQSSGVKDIDELSDYFNISGFIELQIRVQRRTLVKNENIYKVKRNIYIKYEDMLNNQSGIIAYKINSRKLKVNKTMQGKEKSWRLFANFDSKTMTKFCFDLTVEIKIQIKIPRVFSTMYNDTELTDFELRGTDGSVFAHKVVLAGCSPVFKRMLSGEWIESISGFVNVKDTKQETLKRLKDFIYLNVIPDTDFDNLLKIASRYMISDLEYCCTVKLLTTISAERVPQLLEFALKYKLKGLYNSVMLLVYNNEIEVDEINRKFHFNMID